MPKIHRTTRDLTLAFADAQVTVPVVVRYVHCHGSMGMREPMTGLQLEPDTPAGIEIINVWPTYIDALLTPAMFDALEQDILESDGNA